MRFLFTLFLIAASPASACNTELISVHSWSAENINSKDGTIFTKIDATYQYNGSKAYRMIKAYISFNDVLGEHIAVLAIDRDTGLSPSDTSSLSMTTYGPDLPRLATVKRDDIVVTTCVRAVVYEDGTKEEFHQDASKP